jgi:hypothetical protein
MQRDPFPTNLQRASEIHGAQYLAAAQRTDDLQRGVGPE